MDNLIKEAPKAIPVAADNHTGCLALFQQGEVAAITGDDTVLAGLAAQDPYAVVPDQKAFTERAVWTGLQRKDVDFVRFVNARLDEMRADGEWTRIYNRWLRDALGPAPTRPKRSTAGRDERGDACRTSDRAGRAGANGPGPRRDGGPGLSG